LDSKSVAGSIERSVKNLVVYRLAVFVFNDCISVNTSKLIEDRVGATQSKIAKSGMTLSSPAARNNSKAHLLYSTSLLQLALRVHALAVCMKTCRVRIIKQRRRERNMRQGPKDSLAHSKIKVK